MDKVNFENKVKVKPSEASQGPKSIPPTPKKKLKLPNWKFLDILKSNKKFIGGFLIFSSIFLLFSFISYLFTGNIDQSITDNSIIDIQSKTTDSQNFMGRIGAFSAELFLKDMFGISSSLLTLLLGILGWNLIKPIQDNWKRRFIRFTLLGTFYFSALFGFLFKSVPTLDYLGGAFGFALQDSLRKYIGTTGLFILLLIPLVILLWEQIYRFAIHLKNNAKKKSELSNINIETELKETFPQNKSKFTAPQNITSTSNQNNEFKENLVKKEATVNYIVKKDSTHIESFEINTPNSIAINKENGGGPKSAEEILDEIERTLKRQNQKNETLNSKKVKSEIGFEVKVNNEKINIDENKSLGNDNEDEIINRNSLYQYPTLALLRNHGSGIVQIDNEELALKKQQIIETLGHFKIGIDSIKATVGPTVTLYEVIPSPGVKISRIKGLVDDIALSLSALGIRIIAPIPGKGTIGIEVPNARREIVSLKEALASDAFANSTFEIPIVLGKTINNQVFVADLTKMPHLLMAGATGQGKSVGINTIISSVLYKKHPADVKFVLIDPKKVELNLYKKIEKHFLASLPDGQESIITDTKLVVDVLKSLCFEMDARYEKLKEAEVRNIKEYNAKILKGELDKTVHIRLPYIILVIDELADLMMTAGKEVEMPIARLAQLARAIGIHLIVATQRPSVNIITGSIKANFPARLSFKVTSKVDSRTILDASGADQLVGMGDMLFSTGNDIIRLQCPFIDTDEVEKLNEHIALQPYPEEFKLKIYSSEDMDENGNINSYDDDIDPLFEEAARLVVSSQQGSTSNIQRRMKLGYNRAGRIMDQLEHCSIVGKADGSKPREVLVPDEYVLEQYLSKILNK